ncbi:T9SS type A sorting domain-containing protein [Aquimarina pacifica]|uniref:T9SS type A sorting domain-containing protein n=1 Tax=Aquimarina pacifica TaxID=1296415 RepID=UPI000471EB97|nr:T9SS type A sorting domain-containing protein [Aquimarina pacifica]
MKNTTTNSFSIFKTTEQKTLQLVAIFIITFFSITTKAQNTVYLNSNSEWVSEVNSVQEIYTHMFDAINNACERADNGAYINIKNSGTAYRRNSTEPRVYPAYRAVYAITPKSGQTLDFRNYEYSKNSTIIINNTTADKSICGIHAYRKDNVTIKNLKIEGDPRYAIWFRNSNDITISNITMDLSYGLSWSDNGAGIGIRVDNQADKQGKDLPKYENLTINGVININGTNTHGIETFGIDTVKIDDVIVTNTGGCGVLLNNSIHCEVGVITGYKNCLNEKYTGDHNEGYYSTFRVANGNGTTTCKGVYSRNSGKGFSSVSSSNCEVDYVDIKNTSSECILIAYSENIHVKGGTTSTYGVKKSVAQKDSITNSNTGNNSIKLTDFNTIVTDNTIKKIIIDELEMGFYDIGTGGAIEKDDTRSGYGFCNTANENAKGIIWNVNGAAGTYTFRWKFANGTSTNRSALVYINGRAVSTRNFYGTGSWDKWATTSVTVSNVESGIKNIRLEANQSEGLANIDYIEVTGPGVIPSLIRFNDESIPTITSTSAKAMNSESPYQENNIEPIQKATVKVFDFTGQLVKQTTINSNNESADISDLEQGIYIIQIARQGSIETTKIFKH